MSAAKAGGVIRKPQANNLKMTFFIGLSAGFSFRNFPADNIDRRALMLRLGHNQQESLNYLQSSIHISESKSPITRPQQKLERQSIQSQAITL
jgi:hypothetical protein